MISTRRTSTALALAGLLLAATALPGCLKVGPDYKTPETKTPASWDLPDDKFLKPDPAAIQRWWEVFGDPQLNELIVRAGQSNLDLRTAHARVKEAWANIGVVRGEIMPALSASGSYARQRGSEYAPTPGGVTFDNYQIGANASWEIDLFGRISRSIEAATADYQASEEDRVDVMVSLYAQVATTYFTIRATQAQLAATNENIQSQKQVLALTQSRFRNGLANDLDVSQAETVLASTQAEVPPLKITLAKSFSAMDLLLGQPPGASAKLLGEVEPIAQPPRMVAVGAPADILRQRPDIRRAERQLAAATARVGQDTARLYPSFSLLGNIGLASTNASDLFRSGSYLFSLGPQFNWNVFQGGAIRAQIQVRDAQTEQALLNYEQTVLSALKEAQDAQTAYVQQLARVEHLARTVSASRRTLKLGLELYKEGLTDFQSVLDAQRTLFQYDNQLAQAKGEAAGNLVGLYKALGGGWRAGQHADPAQGPAIVKASADQRP